MRMIAMRMIAMRMVAMRMFATVHVYYNVQYRRILHSCSMEHLYYAHLEYRIQVFINCMYLQGFINWLCWALDYDKICDRNHVPRH